MGDNAIWNLGAKEWLYTMPLSDMYIGERGAQVGNSLCTAGTPNCNDSITRIKEWQGKVGLIYPSDYGYASANAECPKDIVDNDSLCEVNNWLHIDNEWYWTISLHANSIVNATRVWFADSSRSIIDFHAYNPSSVRPSVYLSPDVKIIDGTGTKTAPYILNLN